MIAMPRDLCSQDSEASSQAAGILVGKVVEMAMEIVTITGEAARVVEVPEIPYEAMEATSKAAEVLVMDWGTMAPPQGS